MAKKFFYAYPNPFIHLDHDGYPAGVCPCDMPEHVGMLVRKWVGASLDHENTFLTEKLSQEERRYRDPRQQTRFKFNLAEPTMLPVTEYYRDRFRGREILPADAATARLAGVPFVDPIEALRAEKVAAIARWRAENGPDETPEGIGHLDVAIASLGAPAQPSGGPQGDAE